MEGLATLPARPHGTNFALSALEGDFDISSKGEATVMLFPIGDDNSTRRSVPLVTWALIALNVIFFFVEMSGGEPFIRQWSVVPRRLVANPAGDAVTIFTSMFMHGGWMHLLGNMLYLW